MTIRPANLDDAARIDELLAQLGYPPVEDNFAQSKIALYANESYRLLVCDVDGLSVGFVSLHWFDMFHRPKKMGRITALCVDENLRAQGIGGALLTAAEAILRDQNCDHVEVTTNFKRSLTPSFYEKHGYLETSRHFVKHI